MKINSIEIKHKQHKKTSYNNSACQTCVLISLQTVHIKYTLAFFLSKADFFQMEIPFCSIWTMEIQCTMYISFVLLLYELHANWDILINQKFEQSYNIFQAISFLQKCEIWTVCMCVCVLVQLFMDPLKSNINESKMQILT